MGKPPAVVVIARYVLPLITLVKSSPTERLRRHGARIDAVDKTWHLTSPVPYDPPLTYGGWVQGRALGARIASLLQAPKEAILDHNTQTSSSSNGTRNSAVDLAGSGQDTQTLHTNPLVVRKHKVIIHSSPYIRCVQTAIAISAGISQHHRTSNRRNAKPASTSSKSVSKEASPESTPILRPADNAVQQEKKRENDEPALPEVVPKTRLRIDAFLGEWLSPEYFENITSPPSSVMMVVAAKAELLRRGESIQYGSKPISGNFPGGWRSNSSPAGDDEGPFQNMAAMADSLAEQQRPESHDGPAAKLPTIRDILSRRSSDASEDFSEGYIPPVPSYAVSPSDPIPAGYVTHARDACVDVDYQWDSMREPQNWGSGGEYGEEWSAMHLRFRNGLQSMIDWYRTHDHPPHYHHDQDSDDDLTDVVLVLVTHGAGCNALIGALTDQPVLVDVPMASLTMAVRKDIIAGKDIAQKEEKKQRKPDRRRRSSLDTSIAHEYDVSLIASTDHLRAESNASSISRRTGPAMYRSASVSAYRHRLTSPHEPLNSTKPSLHRCATTNSRHPSRGSSGLWGSVSSTANENVVESSESDGEKSIIPNFGIPASASSSKPTNGENGSQTAGAGPQRPKSQRGLWSSAVITREREPAPKRRWTVTERR
jgi:hypothetical protein